MKLSELLREDRITLSFEVFPPKKETGMESVLNAAKEIAAMHPDFMSVTYGAAGTTRGYTHEVASKILQEYGVSVMPHLTCISSTKQDVQDILTNCKAAGITNIMALRGDIPQDGIVQKDFPHASDLIRAIRENPEFSDFSIGAACYPEGHVESANKEEDLTHLKEKVDAGADFLTTQMFFDNNVFYNFLYRAREKGIQVPVLAGIMPITRAGQQSRSVALSGTSVPDRFTAIVDHFGQNEEAMKQAGILYASDQIVDLIAHGVKHFHIYSMNKPEVAAGILANIKPLLS